MASWAWEIADNAGNSLTDLATATPRALTYKRNLYTEATFTISHADDSATDLLNCLQNTGIPKLRCYRRADGATTSELKFRGQLAAAQEEAEEASTLTPVFRSPFAVLYGDGNERGRFITTPLAPYATTDAGQIAKSLIDLANTDGFTGLATTGTIEATVNRDRAYPVGTNIGQGIVNLTNVLDGFDFYEQYVDGAGTTDAEFVVAARQGEDRSEVLFEYGAQTSNNVRQLSRSTEPPANCILVLGGNNLTATYEDATSVAKYGRWWVKVEFSDVTEQATLDAKARALIRPNPVRTISFVPDALLAPRPFDDFDMGDRVSFYARRDGLTEDVAVRVNAFTVLIDDDGHEADSIDDTSTAAEETLQAVMTVEVVE